MKFFALLVCAHILGDFLLQPDCMVKHKNNNWVFLIHLFIHGLVGWLCIAQWNVWVVPFYIFATHGLFDWVKRRMSDTAQSFIVNQCLHLLTLFILEYYLNSIGLLPPSGISYKVLVWIAGFVATVQGSGYLVAKVTNKLVEDNNLKIDGLAGGGKLIGQLERILIFLMVVIGQPGGIGFLIAAKSILRFEKAQSEAKHAEYVLNGTLLSFTLAIALNYCLPVKPISFSALPVS